MLIRVFFGLIVLACSHSTNAAIIVQRDTIGVDSSLTDGMPGASAFLGNSIPFAFQSPGARFVATDNGILHEAKFVIFAFDTNGPLNDPSFFDTLQLTFNLWIDGIQSGTDSFANNPAGNTGNGHVVHVVNDHLGGPDVSSLEVLGQTGPPGNPSQFTTYLVTVDLSSFAIEIDAQREYVFNIIQNFDLAPNSPYNIRLVGSTVQDGTEDVWFTSDFPVITPGFVNTQQAAGFELFGTSISINTDSADFDTDNDIDGADFLAWQRGFGTMGGASKTQGDANDDGNVNAADLAVWENQFGDVNSPLLASTTVPEPTTAVLLSIAITFVVVTRREHAKLS